MECKFLKHGLAIQYDQIVKPCCEWRVDPDYAKTNHVTQVDLNTWHKSTAIANAKEMLANNQWPSSCDSCKIVESQGRSDSIRLGGESAYANYREQDITLEIRPGSICNFACQTCWPAASSRVAEYHVKAGLIQRDQINSNVFTDFDQLLPIANRIKNVVLLGGEPFYDPACKKFIAWAAANLSADILMFTNGSMIDWDFLANYPKNIILVFSLDAAGKPAEYIRQGTDWNTVLANYQRARTLPNVSVRVNVTVSVYNYMYLEELFDILCSDWPDLVTFSVPFRPYHGVSTIPLTNRSIVVDKLLAVKQKIMSATIEQGQWHNAVNAIQSTVDLLTNTEFNQSLYDQLIDVISRLDAVKHLDMRTYCPELADVLAYKPTKLLI